MAKYKVLKRFRNIETKETYKINQEIELTDERVKDIVGKLKNYGGGFIEEIPVEKDPKDAKPEEDKKDKK